MDGTGDGGSGINGISIESRAKLDALFEAFSIVAEGTYVYLCDMEYDYSRWSQTAVDYFGLPGPYMFNAGEIWEEHIHPEDREAYHRSIDSIFSGGNEGHDMQYRARALDGQYVVCTCRGVVLNNVITGAPKYFAGAIRNHGLQGHIDTLTGLRNQYGFFEDLNTNILKNREVTVGMIGIGHFTEINEYAGYNFGNLLLQKVSRYLLDFFANRGSVYRLDGTKFGVITGSLTIEAFTELYNEIREHFREVMEIDGQNVTLLINGGCMRLDNFQVDNETIYACLNFAYGESKLEKQGEMVVFFNDITEENRHRMERLQSIRNSVVQNCEGFFLLYQPIVDSSSEKLKGAEALLRWRNDEFGLTPPDSFVPLLERDALFPILGEWIMKKAMTDARSMLERYPEFVVNVNLSYSQLEKPDFVDMVKRLLKETGLPPLNLCLEITERCRFLNIGLLKKIIMALRSIGIRFAMDDFGTGFSSVGMLKKLPFDTIKIDRSFVSRIEEDKCERELMEHFTSFVGTFGAKVCVEGIETPGMKEILKKYRVSSFQGYYYAKPITIEELRNWKPQ